MKEFDTHKDLLVEIEKKELKEFLKVRAEIEEFEKQLSKDDKKVSKQEVEDVFLHDKPSGIQGIVNEPSKSVLENLKEVSAHFKRKKENKETGLKKYVNQLNKIIDLDDKQQNKYEKIIQKLYEEFHETNSKLIQQIHINEKLKDALYSKGVELNKELIDTDNERKQFNSKLSEKDKIAETLNREFAIKNSKILFKIENLIKEKKETEAKNIELIAKLKQDRDDKVVLVEKIEELENKLKDKDRKIETINIDQISLNQQIHDSLAEIESIKREFDNEMQINDKTVHLNRLLKEENTILKNKIKDLNSHQAELSQNIMKLIKENQEKDKYYPALFESEKNAIMDKMHEIETRQDSAELSNTIKQDMIKELENENRILKEKLEQTVNPTIEMYEETIDRMLKN